VSQYNADKYRQWAAECLSFAATAQRDDDKSTWLELASKWQRLAEEAGSRGEQSQQPPPEPEPKS
jgi:hypothetical protein